MSRIVTPIGTIRNDAKSRASNPADLRRASGAACGEDAHELPAHLADGVGELREHVERQRIGAHLELERSIEQVSGR